MRNDKDYKGFDLRERMSWKDAAQVSRNLDKIEEFRNIPLTPFTSIVSVVGLLAAAGALIWRFLSVLIH